MGTGELKKTKGLCSGCRSADICFYRNSQSSDPQECELYEPEWGIKVNPESEAIESAESKLVGLCVNCERRAICRLPKPAGGVWHCDEYL